jgi:hypothetical protein
MALLPDLQYCCVCGCFLGPDNYDGICCECDEDKDYEEKEKLT